MLSILVFLPLAGGVLAALVARSDEYGARRAGAVSTLFALATLGLSIALIADFDSGAAACSTSRTSPGSPSSASTTGSGSTASTCS